MEVNKGFWTNDENLLVGVRLPSLRSADRSRQIDDLSEPWGIQTDDFRVYEMRANRKAAKYFEKYYDVDWNTPYLRGTYETYYPTVKR